MPPLPESISMKLRLTVLGCLAHTFILSMAPAAQKVIFVVGPAGSGKTTAATAYTHEHVQDCAHYSVGNLLREQAKNETEFGLLIRGILERAEIVPLKIGMQVVEDAIMADSKPIIIIDGFPPTLEYMDAFEQMLESKPTLALVGVISIDVDPEIAQERVSGRLRSDDKKENFIKRYARFMNNRDQLHQRFAKYGLEIIDGNQSQYDLKELFFKTIDTLSKS